MIIDERIEKTYTLKGVKSEITRLEKSRDKKKARVKQLTNEIKADGIRLKELESIYDSLYNETIQRQIAATWFKGKKLTGEQITKFLELSTQISDKIDILDVETVVQVVTTVYNEKQKVTESAAPADDIAHEINNSTSCQSGYYNDSAVSAYTEREVSESYDENS